MLKYIIGVSSFIRFMKTGVLILLRPLSKILTIGNDRRYI